MTGLFVPSSLDPRTRKSLLLWQEPLLFDKVVQHCRTIGFVNQGVLASNQPSTVGHRGAPNSRACSVSRLVRAAAANPGRDLLQLPSFFLGPRGQALLLLALSLLPPAVCSAPGRHAPARAAGSWLRGGASGMADGAAGEEIVATDLVLNEPKKNRHDPVDAAPSIAVSHLLHLCTVPST